MQRIAAQQLRARRQSVVNEVKQAYYDILKPRSSLRATKDSIAYYTDLDREVAENYRQQTVLEYQLLEVESRLAATSIRRAISTITPAMAAMTTPGNAIARLLSAYSCVTVISWETSRPA